MRSPVLSAGILSWIPALFFNVSMAQTTEPPRLVLQITVDQLRADLPTRYYARFGEGGFRYLFEQGIRFTSARHAHANTETIVGHTTLATGAHPATHGMVGNLWFDREAGSIIYNVEDARYPLLTADGGINQAAEIDPTQRAARSDGRSPNAIEVSTFSDELRAATAGQSKSVAVSVKDRGAISMAGHSGTAYWFSKAKSEFVTSTYYKTQYPAWVESFNAARRADVYANSQWNLLGKIEEYRFGESDDRDWETDVGGFGRVFPHDYGDGTHPYFSTWLTLSPAGDELVLDFAKAAIAGESLGHDAVTDYLSVSFSSTDYVGHVFGPSSLEAEDNLLQLDRRLAELFSVIDDKIGLDKTLVVLSADHGAPDSPGYLNSLKIPAGYVDPHSWDSSSAIARVKQAFGINGPLIETYVHPYIYFADAVKNDPAVNQAELASAVVAELSAFSGVAFAVSGHVLNTGQVPATPLYQSVLRNFHSKRSGDIFVVFQPNHFINDFDGLVVASSHGSPWPYDTDVPLIFAGHKLKSCVIERTVLTVDVATTLAAYMGVKRPSGALEGRVIIPSDCVER